ncbi:MAG: hypothetical protein CMN85_08765 [Spongiibacteraceae bacterium]|nr:hypothetical protein [Spongiibacteraceae bacterium]|tara:strand:- start:1769 stop:2575 length:807 start_codon:yes stop_codon:yes gene_type:complete
MRQSIDLNCDLGEGMGSDKALLELVSSANIACGGHAGDQQTMSACVREASNLAVAIGAHPGYCDPENFGRRRQDLSAEETAQVIIHQVSQLRLICQQHKATLSHVRAHGALGNLSDSNDVAARTLATTIAEQFPELAIMTLGHSAAERAAKACGLKVVRQFFADRAYDDEGQLVPRSVAGSVIHNRSDIMKRLLGALDSDKLVSLTGKTIAIGFDSICVHGDTPGALALAEAIRTQLEQNGIAIRPYNRAQQPGVIQPPSTSQRSKPQ